MRDSTPLKLFRSNFVVLCTRAITTSNFSMSINAMNKKRQNEKSKEMTERKDDDLAAERKTCVM